MSSRITNKVSPKPPATPQGAITAKPGAVVSGTGGANAPAPANAKVQVSALSRVNPVSVVLSLCLLAAIGLGVYLIGARALHSSKKEPSSSEVVEKVSQAEAMKKDPWYADPRLSYDGPWKNVKPDVKYVGDAVCAKCHETEHEHFRKHPMGRSAFMVDSPLDDQLMDEKHRNPFTEFGFVHTARKVKEKGPDGKEHVQMYHDVVFPDPDDKSKNVVEIHEHIAVAVGSGVHSRSYLTNHNGFVCESPLTWYGQKQKWDLSPGYETSPDHLFFNRPMGAPCLFCHYQHVDPAPGHFNKFDNNVFEDVQLSIGCERCHGPGQLHVKERKKEPDVSTPDYSIVNPKWLSPRLREMICVQCHLQAETTFLRPGRDDFDFRPGMSLPLFIEMYMMAERGEKEFHAVGQVEQMYGSTCFLKSHEKHPDGDATKAMGCTSCHDPHSRPTPEQMVTQYRDACLQCHAERFVAQGKETPCSKGMPWRLKNTNNTDACADCHMPKNQAMDIPHFTLTDHRVVRKKDDPYPPFLERARGRKLGDDEPPIVAFFDGDPDEKSEAAARSRAIACVTELQGKAVMTEAQRGKTIEWSIKTLKPIVEKHEWDWDAASAYGMALQMAGFPEQAMKVTQIALKFEPPQELAFMRGMFVANANQRQDLQLELLLKLREINPDSSNHRVDLVRLYNEMHNFAGIIEEAPGALEKDPANKMVRQVYIVALWKKGRKKESEEQLEVYQKLNPSLKKQTEEWFEEMKKE
jgi:predicted CXXCH cytochrome family protein